MFMAVWISCLLQHTLHSLSLCSSHHSALDFINMLFDLASTQCKPKNSTELAVSSSTGRRVCGCVGVWCVHGHVLGGVEEPRSPGSGSSESCWLFLEGPRGSQAEPAGLWQAVWAGAWPLTDTRLVVSAVLTSPSQGRPHLPSAHQVGTLQAFSCTGKCFQLWLWLCCVLITPAFGTLRNKILLIGRK